VKIFIDSMSRRFGDTLLGLPFASMLKTQYRDVHITYGVSPYPSDREFLKNISVIDDVETQTIYNPVVRGYDMTYDMVLRASFDSDLKDGLHNKFYGLDNKEGWDKCIKANPIKFNYNQKDEFDKYYISDSSHSIKKHVGIFINIPREDPSMLNEMGSYPVERWQEVVNTLCKKHIVYVFTSSTQEEVKLENCVNMGQLTASEEVYAMSELFDVTIGCSSGIMNMAGVLAQKPLIILDTCEDNNDASYIAPNKCIQPQNRYLYFTSTLENEFRSFIKPEPGARLIDWTFNSYLEQAQYVRSMRVVADIKPQVICDEVDRILDDGIGKEWFVEGKICDNCKMYSMGLCVYEYTPVYRSKSYAHG